MSKLRKKPVLAAVGIGSAVGAAALAFTLQGLMGTASGESPQMNYNSKPVVTVEGSRPEAPALRDFPTNAAGQTYGSDALAESEEDAPDLIAIVGQNGIFGYAYKKDLYAAPSTPEEALKWQTQKPTPITIYAADGTTLVDTYVDQEGTSAESSTVPEVTPIDPNSGTQK